MRISAKSQYACVTLLELACVWGGKNQVQLKTIAETHGLSQRFLVQILMQLKSAGLVETTRGATGGYYLVVPPEQITLAQIIQAADQPPPPLAFALTGLHSTPAVQAIKGAFAELQRLEQQHLESITLADLVKQTQPDGELTYQI
ncbi:MAG: Rrf2 family transcriptional regulator [Gemmataceae bacterium]|nr:Rrf2 family transcriptional regulator [Gemmataceae bacterium]